MAIGAILAGAGMAANLVGGIAAREASRGALGEANNALIEAQEELNRIGLPPDLSKKIIYEQFKQAGILTPQLEKDILAGPSKVSQITEDTGLRDTQKEALKLLSERGRGGLSPEDRAALNDIRNQVARDTEAKRQQILQNFQARGQGGSGNELIAALQASQSGANEASSQGDRLAAMSSANALQAIGQAGTLGGAIRQQDFGVNQARAAAEDALNQFNVQNQIGTQSRNVGSQNQAQAANLANAQNISNANVSQENQERLRQNQAQRTYWQDLAERQQMRAGAQRQRASDLQQQGQQAATQAGAPWEMIGSAATTIGGNMLSPQKKFAGGEIEGYSDGGEVSDFLSSVRGAFGGDPTNKPKEETPEEKYARIREQNRANAGYADGGRIMAEDYTHGGMVNGEEVVPGDHPVNDTVHAMVSPGEIVVPKTIAQGTIGKKLLKLMQNHHELMSEIDNHNKNR